MEPPKKKTSQRKTKPLEWPFHRFSDNAGQRLKRGEAVHDVYVKLGVGTHTGDHRTFDNCRDEKFWLFNTPESGTSTLLAAVLLHVWQTATETKSIKQSLVELVKVAADLGWVTSSDLVSQFKKSNKGGRPPGAVSKDTRQFTELFKECKASQPTASDDSIISQIARETLPKRTSGLKIHREKIRIAKALKRANLISQRNGLTAKSRPKKNGK